MPRYTVTVRCPLSPADAFAYMADLTNIEQWDPGVAQVLQVTGNGPSLGAEYDVDVRRPVGVLTLRYCVMSFDAPRCVVAHARSSAFTSVDTMTVDADENGSTVTYEAVLTLNGLLGLANPFLGIAFRVIGDRAAAGLVDALDGQKILQK